MARLESVALGGYYATPAHLLPSIASKISTPKVTREICLLDPCAADGQAILTLSKCWFESEPTIYACELEHSRHESLENNLHWRSKSKALYGDAFRAYFAKNRASGVQILFLNPPYDTDKVHGRLEEKFLNRFTEALQSEGALIFVVPHYALASSAKTLAKEYKNIHCFRFPNEDYASYKQVVLFAEKSTSLLEPDQVLLEKILSWSKDSSCLPVLEVSEGPLYRLQDKNEYTGLDDWSMRSSDLQALKKKVRPWFQTVKKGLQQIEEILPCRPVQDILTRTYEVATPPRPAHIASGIAAGLFNGSRIEPSVEGFPALLVKGVFNREFRTVEEKKNKEGVVTSVVQIQQPKLVTTVLDLTTYKYHTLGTDGEGDNITNLGVQGLLKYYDKSLVNVMHKQCPVLYDPKKNAQDTILPPTPRKLFRAQEHAVKAIVKLLTRKKEQQSAILLGEIGSGKSTVALMVGQTIKSKHTLVLCPPHLLKSWENEIKAVVPHMKIHVLSSVEDLDHVVETRDQPSVSILSREKAKLSHGWESVEGSCPSCGHEVPLGVDLAKKRFKCQEKRLGYTHRVGSQVKKLAHYLLPYFPNEANVKTVIKGRFTETRSKHYGEKEEKPLFVIPKTLIEGLTSELIHMFAQQGFDENLENALIQACLAYNEESFTFRVLNTLILKPSMEYYDHNIINNLILLTQRGSKERSDFEVLLKNHPNHRYNYGSYAINNTSWVNGKLEWKNVEVKPQTALLDLFHCLVKLSGFKFGSICDEPLFQASNKPKRIALAEYIEKRHGKLFDFLILDEGHEYATDGSAQERSAHRLSSLGMPTLLMTGSIMNGYAESLFTNMWALSNKFRQEFKRGDSGLFVKRYGYLKRVVQQQDEVTREIVEYGSMSERVITSARNTGTAPGVLPLFILQHLLSISVTLHKEDLAIDLPQCKQIKHEVEVDSEMMSRYKDLQSSLVTQIKKDSFEPGLAGKLWGQLAELPSYLDRATSDTGNHSSGDYVLQYPESVPGARVIHRVAPFHEEHLLPKEVWLLDLLKKEIEEGRNVLLISWHVNLLPRLEKLISKHLEIQVPVLYSDKVGTAKRQDWIDKNVVKLNRRVLITNPIAIQTGLNNLVHFSSEVWFENPACNPIVFRQAVGRIDRIGQKKETRVHFPVYANTLQTKMYDLLLQKVAVSVATDGLDPESALQAAGVGDEGYLTGLSLGKQIWNMVADND
jgi:hypothetical protein